MKRKSNIVIKILDGVTSRIKHKGYIMFSDRWINEHDKVLYDDYGNNYNVLDFCEIEENTLVMDTLPYENGFQFMKYSCVKLDKNVKVGQKLYTHKNEF